MKQIAVVFLFGVLLLTVPGHAVADHHGVKIAEKKGIGNYLTDARGMTLYWFKKDTPGKSACTGPCIQMWPIYYRPEVAPQQGLTMADFGTITRKDGTQQTTFRGYPLYYWAGDQKPGDTNGQGVNGAWFVIDPGNFPPGK